jgi:formylmethanofuran dehydrogenase subunit E
LTPDKDRHRCENCGEIFNGSQIRTVSVGTYCRRCLLRLSDEILDAIDDMDNEY